MKNGLVLAWKLKQAIAITFWFHCITLLHSSKYKVLNYPCAVESKIFFSACACPTVVHGKRLNSRREAMNVQRVSLLICPDNIQGHFTRCMINACNDYYLRIIRSLIPRIKSKPRTWYRLLL